MIKLNLKTLKYFIKGYGTVLNLLPKTNDKEEIKKDFQNIAQDFWFVVKEEINFEGKQQKTATR